MTKFKALLDDLTALRASEPSASVVIFTHYNQVLGAISKALREEGLTVVSVSREMDAARRHRALRSFQSAAGSTAMVFATTFATASVGLTLTAASRVYLLEASLDPAQEAQAAGRIHRLGQTKEVLVKRFLFKDSLDEAIHALHASIKAGTVSLQGGRFPRTALDVLKTAGVAQPHEVDENAPTTDAQRRYRSSDSRNVRLYGGLGGYDYGKSVKTRPCLDCDAAVEVSGTSRWWGFGIWAGLSGCTDDHPTILSCADAQACEV